MEESKSEYDQPSVVFGIEWTVFDNACGAVCKTIVLLAVTI